MSDWLDIAGWVGRAFSVLALWITASVSLFSAQTSANVDSASGLHLLVADEDSLPALRILLPGQLDSIHGIKVLFPEHVTVREQGRGAAEHLYLWRPGRQENGPAWRRLGQSLEYEMDLKGNVHLIARATLESDGVRYRFRFVNHSNINYDSVQAIWDPRLYQSVFRDVWLERTYVHRKEGFQLLAVDMPARLVMPLNKWLPCRYLDSYTWPVPPLNKRVVKEEGITYFNASRPVDEPFIATVSRDGKWVAATWTSAAGNVWTNPELTCQHADPETSLKAEGTASLEGKTFIFRGTLHRVLEKVRHERHDECRP